MLHGNETKADAGRIVVTVRPIVRAAADSVPAAAEQLGALSPQFGEEGQGENRRNLGNSSPD
jgi:hypothetical protein